MEIILIIAPCYTNNETIDKFLTELKKLPKEPNQTVFFIKDETEGEWKILSNKLNEELFEKYHEQIKELEDNG